MSENKNKFCIYCGTPLEEGWLFCKQCGKKVNILESKPQEEIVEVSSSTIEDENETIELDYDEEVINEDETIVLDEEFEEEIIYNHNRDDLVDLYNGLARRNSLTIFSIFLVTFLIIIASFTFKLWLIAGIVITVCAFLALAIITTNKSYKKMIDALSNGSTKLEISGEGFVVEKTLENVYERATIKYEEVMNIEENANIMILTTKNNVVYAIDKKALGDKYLSFRNNCLRYVKVCNGQVIKEEQIALGRYDYCEETTDTICVMEAKTKAMRTSSYTIFTAAMLFIASMYFDMLFILLIFVPIGIVEIVYIKKLNKKIQNDFKIVGELIITILVTAILGSFGLLGLLATIQSVL